MMILIDKEPVIKTYPDIHRYPKFTAVLAGGISALALAGCGASMECDTSNTVEQPIQAGDNYWDYANELAGPNADSDTIYFYRTQIREMNEGKPLRENDMVELPADGACTTG